MEIPPEGVGQKQAATERDSQFPGMMTIIGMVNRRMDSVH
jgi:hypothetical protein